MRTVRWLHISDLHMREAEDAPQQTVLATMLEDISRRRATGAQVDFVVATGDLAFSGKRSEYELVAVFLRDLVASVGVSPDKVFCVPGNHDVQRERSKMCFRGARYEIQSEGDVYRFLADDEERKELLRRQENYRAFEACFLAEQDREYTDDRLGYVAKVKLDDLRIAIIGLNSSWLSEGGASDEGKLLIGESQVKSAIDIAKAYAPHIVLSLQHHPFDLLHRFDRRPVQRSLEEACDFVHCGHLHDPNVSEVVVERGRSITITAGASFESRGFRNTFTTVEFDPLAGRTEVVFVEYNPQTSAYEYESRKRLDHPIDGPCNCTVEELADAIDLYCSDAGDLSGYLSSLLLLGVVIGCTHSLKRCCGIWQLGFDRDLSGYLSSLLLGLSSDVPIASNGAVVFGNWDLIESISDAPFKSVAVNLRGVGRAVRLLHGRKSLAEILTAHGNPIRPFVGRLKALSEQEPVVKDYLKMQNEVRARRRPVGNGEPLRHTVDLLMDLMRTDDWDDARNLAERTIDVSEGSSRVRIARILAQCLARSTEESDKARAVELYSAVVESEQADPGDWGALATLMTELKSFDEAKTVIRDGIRRFPDQSQAFVEIGMRLVEASGDRDFRDSLIAEGRGHQGE